MDLLVSMIPNRYFTSRSVSSSSSLLLSKLNLEVRTCFCCCWLLFVLTKITKKKQIKVRCDQDDRWSVQAKDFFQNLIDNNTSKVFEASMKTFDARADAFKIDLTYGSVSVIEQMSKYGMANRSSPSWVNINKRLFWYVILIYLCVCVCEFVCVCFFSI